MKLLFLKEEALETLKHNIEYNIDKYKESNNNWVYELFDGENPFLEFKLEVNYFELKTDFNSAAEMELYNSKILYENLKMLSETQASDERLWAGLAHSLFYDFVRNRWKWDINNMNKPNYIKSRYFYSGGQARGIIRNTLAKLWWIGKFTYDVNRSNPFELTDVLGNGDMATRVSDMFSSNFSRNPKVGHAFLAAIKLYEDEGYKINGNIYRQTIQYLNAFGGMTLIDYLEEKELKNIIIKKISKLIIDKDEPNYYDDTINIYNSIRKIEVDDMIIVENVFNKDQKKYKMMNYEHNKESVVQKKCLGQKIGFEFFIEEIKYKIVEIQ